MKDIITDNTGLIIQAMKDLHCKITSEEDFEDYYFAGLVGLIQASKNYDSSKGKSTYLYRGIRMSIQRTFHMRNTQKRKNEVMSLNNRIADYEYIDLIPIESFENDLINQIFVEELLSKLKDTKYKQYLIEYYGIGCSPISIPKIASKYGITPSCVGQYIRRALELLRKELKNENIKQNKNKIQSKLVK